MWAADDAKFWNLGRGNFVPLSLSAAVMSSFFFFFLRWLKVVARPPVCPIVSFVSFTSPRVCVSNISREVVFVPQGIHTPDTRELKAFFGWRIFCMERNNFTEEGVQISCSKHSIVCARSNSGTCISTGNCLFLTPGNLGRALGASFWRFWVHGLVVPLGLVAEFLIFLELPVYT